MSKTKWYTRATYIVLALALTISLAGIAAVSADPTKQSEWDDVSTPSRDDEVIAPDSNILNFDMGPDGEVIYAVVDTDEDGYGDELYKSDDGGVTWDDGPTEELEEEDMDIPMLVSVASDDADFLVVAGLSELGGDSMVAGSDDGGDDFTDTSFPKPTETILCLDLSPNIDDTYNTAVGTDAGKIYRYEAGAFWGIAWKDTSDITKYPGWEDTKATSGVTSLVFSPAFAGDDTILALTTDGEQVWLQTGLWGTTKGWNDDGCGEPFPDPVAILDTGDDVDLTTTHPTGIALPSNYEGYDDDMRYAWVYVNFDDDTLDQDVGKVFQIENDTVKYAGICCLEDDDDGAYPFMASITMTGEIEDGNLMVGLQGKKGDISGVGNGDATECCDGVQVYRTAEWSIDLCCPQWSSAKKPPTGQEDCLVAYTPDGDKAYAATSGADDLDESAFSLSELEEIGKYWNQLSLIDTYIDYLSDVGVNPDCGTIYLFSVNDSTDCGCDSVWASTDEGDSYMRVWCKTLDPDDEITKDIGLIRLNPEEEEEILTVYLVDRGTKVLYWNDDSGLTEWKSRKAATLDDIMDLAVESEDTVYAVDSAGDVSVSDEHGAPGSWSSAEDAKLSGGGHTIVVVDGNVLVGGDEGTVGYSDDGADSFSRLGDKGDLGTDGEVHVAFDSYFEDNDTVYAAVKDGKQGIYRWVIDDSTSWKDLKATEQDYFGIVLDNADGNPMTDADTGGTLYAVYEDGMARRLKPTAKPSAKKWDYLDNGLGTDETFDIEPSALKICGCLSADTNSILWAINTYAYDIADGEDNLFNYEDCLAKGAPDLSKVADEAIIPADPCVCVNEEFILEWDELCNSSTYVLTIALDEDFDYPIRGMASGIEYDEYEVDDESIVILQGDLDCNQNYWWRIAVVKADDDDEVIRSWFSEGWGFLVEAGPLGAIDLASPDDGATNLPLTSIGFTWSAVAETTSYDWVLSANADLSSPVESKTGLTDTAYTYTGTLKTSTTYFWRATALKDGNILSESDISTFTTAPEPVPPPVIPPVPAPVTPAWVWVVIGLGAVLVIVVIVLIFRTRRV